MPDLTSAEIEVLNALDDALDDAAEVLRPELPDLTTWADVLGRIGVVSRDVYGRICGERGIGVDEEQLTLLQTALALGAATAWKGDTQPPESEADKLISDVVDVLCADPVFQGSQDIKAETHRAVTILDNLSREYGVEISGDDCMAFAAMVQVEWLRVHGQIASDPEGTPRRRRWVN